jgi:L-threonylcarbamoyladenylate synthase
MNTRTVKVDPGRFDAADLSYPAEVIRSGGLCVFPTETVYGIGGDATSSASAARIYAAKGRPSDNPLIVHIAFPGEAENFAVTVPLYYRLAERFMPGPLTVILEKRGVIPPEVTGGLGTVAVRCPSHPVARALISLAGVPVAAPSANISGRPSATSAGYALADFDGRVECVIDGGPCEVGLESTIVRIEPDGSLLLLRPGAVTRDDLLQVCGRVEVSGAAMGSETPGDRPVCPGTAYRHYAPLRPLALVGGGRRERAAFFRARLAEGGTAVICCSEQARQLPSSACVIDIGRRDDPSAQGRRIFAALREADALPVSRIYADLPPSGGPYLALYNRLIRAAAHTVITAPGAREDPASPQ